MGNISFLQKTPVEHGAESWEIVTSEPLPGESGSSLDVKGTLAVAIATYLNKTGNESAAAECDRLEIMLREKAGAKGQSKIDTSDEELRELAAQADTAFE